MQSSSSAEDLIRKAIERARGLEKPPVGEDAIIAYTWEAKPAALALYLSLLHAGLKATIAHAALASVHILPYRETGVLIAYTLNDRDARIVNAAMAASALNTKVYVVGPEMHPAVEETLDQLGVERIIVEGEAPLLTMMVASLFWKPRLMGAREDRVRDEIKSLDDAIEWVMTRYSREIAMLRSTDYERIYYTPSIEAASLYHSFLIDKTAGPLDEIVRERTRGRHLAYIAGVDEHNYKDLLLKASLSQIKIDRIVVNTDPVTLNIYGAMIASLAYNKVA